MKVLQALIAGGIALGVAAPALAADTLTLDFQGVGKGENVKISNNSGSSYSGVFAGQLKWEVVSSTHSYFNPGDSLITFCTDIHEYAGDGTFTLGNVADAPSSPGGINGMGETKAAMLEHLYANHYDSVKFSSASFDAAAAFQIVIWEVVNETLTNGFSLTGGKFRAKNMEASTKTLADSWLSDIFAHYTPGTGQFNGDAFGALRGAILNGGQDQLVVVPLPAPVMLGGVGLLGLAILRKRRKA